MIDLVFQKKFRQVLHLAVFYALPVLLFISMFINSDLERFALLGNIALILVVINLYIKPLSLIFRNSYFSFIMTLRRELGMAAVWYFLFHAGGMIFSYDLWGLNNFTDYTSFLFWGALAAVGMIILGLTSNDYATKLLKQNWKKVQMVAYPTLFLVLFHSSLAKGKLYYFYIGAGVYLILKILQWRKVSINLKF